MRASHDAKRILAIDVGTNELRVWPIADIARADTVAGAGGRVVDTSWRSGVPQTSRGSSIRTRTLPVW